MGLFGRNPRVTKVQVYYSCSHSNFVKSEKSDGTTDLVAFLTQFEVCANYNDWTEKDKAVHLKLSLRGKAVTVLRGAASTSMTYSSLVEHLQRRYGSQGQQVKFRNDLRNRRRQPGESLASLYEDICGLIDAAYLNAAQRDPTLGLEDFLDAINNDALTLRIRDCFPKTIDEAFNLAVMLESYTKTSQAHNSMETAPNRPRRDEPRVRAVQAKAETFK